MKKGQSVLELSLLLIPLMLIVMGFVQISYLGFARLVIDQMVYQGVLCVAEQRPVKTCERMTQEKIKSILPIGKIQRVSFFKSQTLKRRETSYHGHIHWSVKGLMLDFQKKPLEIKTFHSLKQSQIKRASQAFSF